MEDENRIQALGNLQDPPFIPSNLPPLPPENFINPVYQPGGLSMSDQPGDFPYGFPYPNEGPPNPSREPLGESGTSPQQRDPRAVQRFMGVPAAFVKQKAKRRTKKDLNGRDFHCGCGKMYLSYAALYTHIKTKHANQNPPGTSFLPRGRGRGRPRKECLSLLGPLEHSDGSSCSTANTCTSRLCCSSCPHKSSQT